ncbi:ubiquitin-conjugating enzyme E2 1 [Trichinella spiralis]|uniref:ubiquitin-conjugating enzyme E2 1 n=1 Tax=Trichinella spiralis TaxID=6334 RepID=UPI0001EFEAB7|nr:ubiquitin-conjugating enzyme E2 1 [Trichinella spiralis]
MAHDVVILNNATWRSYELARTIPDKSNPSKLFEASTLRLSSALFTQLHPASKLGDSSELLLVRPLRYRLRNPDESFLQVKNAIFEWKGRQLGEVWDCFCVTRLRTVAFVRAPFLNS